ncbi:sensor histidine kinase [Roseospira visakhapatnamensis]|uniref:histidine kinase n=1 Tax=Roseospira visakhapatnamensis TaxID=390880 RepID=A0A7W6REC5_9PROT|nr:HAMP domain-containing sensor histidine kinase [Roseospira visakhapatnamensis]MBB4266981.1 signal transduction histidine kinase [Roseospira visakhapatnamensis]
MDGFLDSFPGQVAILDRDGVILDVNRAWTRFAAQNSYGGPAFQGLNYLSLCGSVSGVERGAAVAVADGIRALVEGRESVFEQVYPCHAPTEKRWFKLLMGRHIDDTVIMVHVDITTEVLSRSFLAQQGFIANTVHDLRTPITALRAYAEMIEMRIEPQRTREFARNIVGAADILLELVNDLLGASEAENGGLLLSDQVIDIADLIRESLVHVHHLAEKRSVTVTVKIDPVPSLLADRRRLRQALINILSNAVKYNRDHGHVTVRGGQDPGGGLMVSVTDSGQGMTPADIERALQPFARTLSAMASGAEGSGLGLPFAHHLVALHDGRLSIDSTPGVGTTVSITFPRWRSVSAGDRSAHPPARVGHGLDLGDDASVPH